MTEPTVDPSKVYALVVGIEQYQAGPDYDLNGPARDALSFAQWLLTHGVQPAHIQLFLSPLEQNRGVLTEAAEQGLTPQTATRDLISRSITNYFFDQGGREKVLYVFWAGHGFITKLKTTIRRLLFADTDTHNKWNLEFDALLQAFQTAQHGKVFPRQIFWVDACANPMFRDFYPTLQAEAAGEGFVTSGTQGQAEQFALFAAAEYAVATNLAQAGTGRFSQSVLAELQAQPLWPDMPELARQIKANFRDQQHLEPVFWSFSLGGGDCEVIDNIDQRITARPMPAIAVSTSERLQLINTLNALTPVDFEKLISALNPPGGIVPPSSAAQGLRSSALLQWIKGPTGPGLNELQAVLGQVMVRDSTAPPPSPHGSTSPYILPNAKASNFIGRKDELKRIEKILLPQSGNKFVVLTGMRGVGKSALACHFAECQRDKFSNGVITVEVGDKNRHTVAKIISDYIKPQISPEGEIEIIEITRNLLSKRQVLLILDNVENTDVKKIFLGIEQCSVIITTINQTLHSSFSIPEDSKVELKDLSDTEALDLLVGGVLEKPLSEDDLTNAKRIIEILGRLPLAIDIARGTLSIGFSLQEYADTLKKRKETSLISHLNIEGDSDKNIESVFDISLGHLNNFEKNIFFCLGACSEDGFSLETAAVVTGHGEQPDVLEDCLKKLCNLSLLNFQNNRYVFHTLILQYAREYAKKLNLLETAQERHAQFFIDFRNQNQSFANEDKEVAKYAKYIGDLILVDKWLKQHEVRKQNGDFALELQRLLADYGYFEEAIRLAQNSQSEAEKLQDWDSVAQFKCDEARYYSCIDKYDKAKEILKSVNHDLCKIDEEKRQIRRAKYLNVLAGIHEKEGNKLLCIQLYKEARQLIDLAIKTFKDQIKAENKIIDQIKVEKNIISEILSKDSQGGYDPHHSIGICYNRIGNLYKKKAELSRKSRKEGKLLQASKERFRSCKKVL
jgi:hypothetical protein